MCFITLSDADFDGKVEFVSEDTPNVNPGWLLACWEAASEGLSGQKPNAAVLNRVVIPQCLAVIRMDLVG